MGLSAQKVVYCSTVVKKLGVLTLKVKRCKNESLKQNLKTKTYLRNTMGISVLTF